MLDQLNAFVLAQGLFQRSDRILLAISGGVDSVVLAHLLVQGGYQVGLAHCNFKLRGQASDEDEQFVCQLAKQLQLPFYTTVFETAKLAATAKTSIQVMARNLRYEWLASIQKQQSYDFIATAHHLNDSIETILYNFTKGTGIKGLHGILPKGSDLVRPLLFATKAQIQAYAQQQQFAFREDASNATDKYARNKIRHHVIPVLQDLNSNFEQTASTTIQNLRETELIFNWAIAAFKTQAIRAVGDVLELDKSLLLQFPATRTVLYEILSPYGFHTDQVQQLLESIAVVGKQFFTATHQLLVDRDTLLLKPLQQTAEAEIYWLRNPITTLVLPNGTITSKVLSGSPSKYPTTYAIAWLDGAKLKYPLRLRHWAAGDSFCPLGMHGKSQKLKAFFANQKLNRFEKAAIWLLESAGEICWVVGHRIDDRFKIQASTTQVIELRWQQNH